MDIGVSLVEAYLRLSGYLTLTEFEVQAREADGSFQTITDVDVMGLRLPGDIYAGDPHGGPDCRLLLIEDPVLQLHPGMVDVLIGEVKQGEAQLNPGLRRHEVLHSLLRRVEWLYAQPMEAVVRDLMKRLVCMSPARGGGEIRTRLVAFGRSPHCDLHTISHAHIVEAMVGFLSGLGEAFRPVQFHEAAPAMLSLLIKDGFRLTRAPEAGSAAGVGGEGPVGHP
ncbi:MAG TPA: hypothetical protein VMX37_04585 [Acidimicrobiia bacterium]|nr:hypothetical protein [Acidimicrobiia bacterium]